MAMSPEEKAARQVTNAIADFRFNDAHFAQFFTKDSRINVRFANLVMTYIQIAALKYKYGTWDSDQELDVLRTINKFAGIIEEENAE